MKFGEVGEFSYLTIKPVDPFNIWFLCLGLFREDEELW